MNRKVSVVIPFYNNEHHIAETVASVYAQAYKDIEVIIVDDGSRSAGAIFLNTLEEIYPDLIVIHKINEGQSVARNTGAAKATGKYLLFVDGDDKIDPAFIEKCMAALDADARIRLVYSRGENFGAKTGEWVLPEYSPKKILFENSIPITALMYKSDFEESGGFDPRLDFYEDWDLWLSVIRKGAKVVRIDEKLFFYRRREESNSLSDHIKDDKERISDNFFKIYTKHIDFYKQSGIYFIDFFRASAGNYRFKKKYYNLWYKKLFYSIKKLFKKQKQIEATEFEKIMEEINF